MADNTKKVNPALAPLSWTKNLAKSFGYAIGDKIADSNPVIKNLVSETKKVSEELFTKVKDFKSPDNDIVKFGKETFSNTLKNSLEDLKSGNLYNKQRMEAAGNELASAAFGLDMSELEFDMSDLEDWGDDFSDEDVAELAGNEAIISNDNLNTARTINAMDAVGGKVAGTISTVTAESANYIVQSNNKSSKILFDLNQKGFATVTESIMAVNNSVVSLAKIGQPLTDHINNSATFYTKTTEMMSQMNQYLGQIAENTKPLPTSSSSPSEVKGTFSSIFDSNGINLSGFIDMIKEGFGESVGGLFDPKAIIEAGGLKNISLPTLAIQKATELLFTKNLENVMKEFNESLRDSMGAGLLKLKGKGIGGGLGSMFLDFLFPKDGFKDYKSYDTSKYEKGPIQFDGITKKAITEVIPITLMKIYSAITGEDEMRYDYSKGKFVKYGKIKQDIRQEKSYFYATDYAQKTKDAANDYLAKLTSDPKVQAALEEQVSSFFRRAFEESAEDLEFDKITKDKDFYKNYKGKGKNGEDVALSEEVQKALVYALKNRGTYANFMVNRQKSRDDYGDLIRAEEAKGSSLYNYINDDWAEEAKKNKPKGGRFFDEFGNNSLFYLRGIYELLGGNPKAVNTNPNNTNSGGKTTQRAKTTKDANATNLSSSSDNNEDTYMSEATIERLKKEGKLTDDNKLIIKQINEEKEQWEGRVRSGFENSKIGSILTAPANAVAGLISSINGSIQQLFWGGDYNNPDDKKSLFGVLITKAGNGLDKLFEKLFDGKTFKEKLDEWTDKIFGKKGEDGNRTGGFLSDFFNDTKENLKGAWKWLKSPFTSEAEETEESGQGSGLFYISGGGRGRRRRKKRNAKKKKLSQRLMEEANNALKNKVNEKVDDAKDDFSEKVTKTIENTKSKIKDGFDNFANSKVGKPVIDNLKAAGEYTKNGIINFADAIFGDPKKTDEEKKKIKENISKASKGIFGEMSRNKGAMGAGAIIGAGTSILTGAVVGPLAGAAIGAAAGLIVKSDFMQDMLFGKQDENGERNGGLFSKELTNFIKKEVPNIGRGAAIGAAGGLFMGSPFIGAIVGGGLGFVASSENAKKWLFGEIDKETGERKGGIIPKDVQKRIKEALPAMTAGAIGGLAIGPFGLAGNLVFGAALGYATTSKSFRDFLFGDKNGEYKTKGLFGNEKSKKALLPRIREIVIGPLDDFMHNGIKRIRGFLERVGRRASKMIYGIIKRIGESAKEGRGIFKIFKPLYGAIGGLTKGMLNFGTFLTEKVFGGISKGAKRANLRMGYGVYGNKYDDNGIETGEKGELTARERLLLRQKIGTGLKRDRSKEFDEYLDEFTSDEDKTNEAKIKELGEIQNALVKYNKVGTTKDEKKEILNLLKKYKDGDKLSKTIKKNGSRATDFSKLINTELEALKGEKKDAKETLLDKLINLQVDSNKSQEEIKEKQEKNNETQEEHKSITEKIKESVTGIPGKLESIGSYLKGIANKIGAKTEDNKTIVDANGNPIFSTIREAINNSGDGSRLKKIISGAGKSDKKVTKSIFDPITGFIIKMKNTRDGDMEPDKSDSSTKESSKIREKLYTGIGAIGGLSDKLSEIGNFFKSIKDKLLGSEEKKGIFDKLFGEDGILSGMFSDLFKHIVDGFGPLKKVLDAFKNFDPVKFLKSNVPLIATVAAMSGALDPLVKNLTNGAYGGDKIGAQDDVFEDANGNIVTKNENGDFVDANGNVVDGSTVTVRKGGSDGLQSNMIKGTVKGAARGQKTLLGYSLKKSSIGKAGEKISEKFTRAVANKRSISRQVSNAYKAGTGEIAERAIERGTTKTAAEITKLATKNASNAIADGLETNFSKLPDIVSRIPVLKNIPNLVPALQNMAPKLAKKIAPLVAKAAAGVGRVAAQAGKLVPVLNVVLIVADFMEGYEDARTTLKIIDEPTVPQRIICGLMRMLKNLIPVVGPIVPDSLLVDLLVDYVGPLIGINAENFKAQRQKAQETVNKYNAEHKTDYDVSDFNKKVLKDYTFVERYENGIKTTINQTTEKAKNFGKNIKDKGFSGAIADEFGKAVTAFNKTEKAEGGGISGAVAGIGAGFKSMLPGLWGDIGKAKADIFSKALKGDIAGLWTIDLPDFSGGGEDTGVDGLKTAVPGIFSRILGQMPLLTTKIVGTVIGAVPWIGKKLYEILPSGITEPIIDGFNNFVNIGKSAIFEDPVKMWMTEPVDNPKNPINGFMKVFSIAQKVAITPISIFNWIGKNLVKTVWDWIVTPITDGIVNLGKGVWNAVIEGPGTLWKDDTVVSENNPLWGLFKVAGIMEKVVLTPLSIFSWLGKKIVGGISQLIGDFPALSAAIGEMTESVSVAISKGSISDVIGIKVEGPKGGLAEKLFGVAKPLIVGFGVSAVLVGKVVNSVKNIIEPVVAPVKAVIDDVWNNKLKPVFDALGGFFDNIKNFFGGIGEKLFGKANGGPGDILGGIKNTVSGFTEGIADTVSDFFTGIFGSGSGLLSGGYSGVKDPVGTFKNLNSNSNNEIKILSSIKNSLDKITYGDKSKSLKVTVTDLNINPENKSIVTFLKNNANLLSALIKGSISFAKADLNKLKIDENNKTSTTTTTTNPLDQQMNQIMDKYGADKVSDAVTKLINTGMPADKAKQYVINNAKELERKFESTNFNSLNSVITGSGSRLRYISGGSSGFVSQTSSDYDNISYAGSSFAEKGCAPSVASMAANAAGKNLSVSNAISASNGYQNQYGTSIDYFDNALGKVGVDTSPVSTGGALESLSRGNSVIMLGRDPSNTSKANSPFGPNGHYVLATGMDSDGNITVNDPEMSGPTSYPASNLLRGMSMGEVISGGGSKKKKGKKSSGKTSGKTSGTSDFKTLLRVVDSMWTQEMGHGSPGKIGKPLKDGAGKNYGMFSFTEKHVMKPFMSWMKKKYPDLAATMDAEVCSSKFDQQWKAAGEKNKDAMIAAQVDYVFKRDWMKGIVPNFKKHTGIDLNDGRLSEGAVGLAMEAYNWAPAIFTSSGGKWGIADSLKKYGNKLDSKKFIKVLYKKLHERAVANSSYGGENGPLSKRWARSLKAANKLNTKSFSYSGKGVSSKDIFVDSVGVGDTTISSSSGEQQTVQSQDYLGTINSIFSDALSKVFGNEGTTTNTTTTTSSGEDSGEDIVVSSDGTWLSSVKKTKKIFANRKFKYSHPDSPYYVNIKGLGKDGKIKKYRTRPDCSGLVSAMLTDFANKPIGPMSSHKFGASNKTLEKLGFKHVSWEGWDKLQPGDIIANPGSHVEVAGGKGHMVYNGGSTKALAAEGLTNSGHKSYQHVWRYVGKDKSGKGSGLLDIINSPNFIEYTSGSGTNSNELKQRISTKKMAEKIIKFTGNGNNEAAVKLIYNKIFTNEDPSGMKALTGNKTKSEKEYMKLYKKMVEYIGNMNAKLDNLEKTVNIESQLLALFKDFATKLLAMKTAEIESGESSSELDPEFETLMNTLVNLAK